MRKCFEIYFNNSEKSFERTLAKTKEEAINKIKKLYPNNKITGIKEV